MVKTASSMLPLGTQAPQFSLKNVVDGKMVNFNTNHHDIATVIMFICNHCPYVKHISQQLYQLPRDYANQRIRFLAINANDTESYPDDSPEQMQRIAKEQNYLFPYLFDETQEVASAYHATCTPDFFIFNKDNQLVYRGQLDDSRPGNHLPVDGHSIRLALDCIIHNQPIPDEIQKPSLGCNIKWKNS